MATVATLVRQAKQGNRTAYDKIVVRFQRMAVVYARSILGDRHISEDVTQEAFIEAYLHLGSLKDPYAFPGWFRTIVFRQCMRITRRRSVDTVSLDHVLDIGTNAGSVCHGYELVESRSEIDFAVAQLAEPERVVVVLYYFGEQSVAEVASFLSLPTNTIKKRLQSARRKLSERMIHLMPKTSIDTAIVDNVRKMLDAANSGNVDLVRTLLDADAALANAVDGDYATPLHHTVESNSVEVANLLIAAGADLNAKYRQTGHTPLSWAITYGSFDIARALIAGGAHVDLWCAAGMGDLAVVESFWDARAQLADLPSTTGSSRYDKKGNMIPRPPVAVSEILGDALYIAARNGHVDVALFLIDRGADVHFRAFLGATPLHWAYFANSKPIIEALVAAGADANILDYEQQAPACAFGILEATSFGLVERLRSMIVDDPALVSSRGRYGTPLHVAARYGNTEAAALLVEFAAPVDAIDDSGDTPINVASKHGHHNLADWLQLISATTASRRPTPANTVCNDRVDS